MSHNVANTAIRCQGNSLAPANPGRDKSVVPDRESELEALRQDFRAAIEDSGEKKEAIAAAIGLPGPEYLSKLFSGEKPITARHITGLPNHVEQIFERKRAERRGLLVVEPVDEATAQRCLAIGLLNALRPAPAKADLPSRPAKAVR